MIDLITSDLSLTNLLIWAVLVLAGYYVLSWVFDKTPKNLPPGPREWGTSWKVLKACSKGALHELVADWARQYDYPITYVKACGLGVAFVNTSEMSRRILNADEYKNEVADRMLTFAPTVAFYSGKDILFTKFDAKMKKKRRMFHQFLGLYGDGVEKFETVIHGEHQRLFEELEQHENQDFELGKSLSTSLKIILYIMCVGSPPSDLKTADILEEYDLTFNRLLGPEFDFVLSSFPLLAKIPSKYKRLVDKTNKFRKLVEEIVYETCKSTYVPGNPRGIVDLLFDHAKKPGNEFLDEDPEQIKSFILSLLFSAHITSRTNILAVFLCLLNYPDVTKNIQEEIDRVIGNRKPRVEDRPSMPYTEAALLEVLRLLTQMPISAIRAVNSDLHVDDLTIPKGTILFTNIWFFQHDERIWDDPWTLKPERFLNSSGQLLPADDPLRKKMLAFGTGMRSCPAEVFAKCRVFLYVTSILQRFDLLPPANEKLVPADFRCSPESVRGFVRQVQPFKCRIRRRQNFQTPV